MLSTTGGSASHSESYNMSKQFIRYTPKDGICLQEETGPNRYAKGQLLQISDPAKKEHNVKQSFLCIVCQEVTMSPVTTPCLHSLGTCVSNWSSSLRALVYLLTTEPCQVQTSIKEELTTAVPNILPGYDDANK